MSVVDASLLDRDHHVLAFVLRASASQALPGMTMLDRSMQIKKSMMKFMTTLSVTAAGLLLAGTALAQPYGMGPDMMSGYGGADGMGPGGMRGGPDGTFASLKLSSDQRKRIADIQATSSKAMCQLMSTMHEQGYHMQGMYSPGQGGRGGGAQVLPDHGGIAAGDVRLAARYAQED